MKYRLTGKIIDVKGKCEAGHEVGEEINLTIYSEKRTVKGVKLCPYFMASIFPFLCVMQFGGQFPWEKDPNSCEFVCLDFVNQVKIRIERTPVEEEK